MEEKQLEETKLGVWGNNTYGQVAVDSKSEMQIFIPKMLSFEIDIRDISCGIQHTLFRSVEGEIFVTGDNSKCQLGIDKQIKRRVSPTAIQLEDPQEKVLLAQAQGYHCLIYTEYGNLYSWGDNTYGQLGTGDFQERETPFNITNNLKLNNNESVIQISLGRETSFVLMNTGKIKCWGSNSYYQLGVESEKNEETPLPQDCLIDDIRFIAGGYEHTLFLDKNGDLYGCGNNSKGQLISQNESKYIKQPTYIQTPGRVKKIFASQFSALVTEKDDLFVWGDFMSEVIEMTNFFEDAQMMLDNSANGKEQVFSNMSSKNQVNKSQMKVRVESVGLGFDFIVAADDYGDVYSWGNNESGQLGQIVEENQTGIIPYESQPKKLLLFAPFDVKSVFTGHDYSILLLADKTKENYEGTSVDYIPYNAQYGNDQEVYEEEQESVPEVEEEKEDEQYEDEQYIDEESQDKLIESTNMKINKNDPLFHIFRMIVFLYEDLRYKLIKIIDENVDVDSVLTKEFINLIKSQQDIIDEYLKIFNLKHHMNFEVDSKNINKFQFENSGNFMQKNFNVGKNTFDQAQQNIDNQLSNQDSFNKERLLQKLKIERDIVEQRLSELKEYIKDDQLILQFNNEIQIYFFDFNNILQEEKEIEYAIAFGVGLLCFIEAYK